MKVRTLRYSIFFTTVEEPRRLMPFGSSFTEQYEANKEYFQAMLAWEESGILKKNTPAMMEFVRKFDQGDYPNLLKED